MNDEFEFVPGNTLSQEFFSVPYSDIETLGMNEAILKAIKAKYGNEFSLEFVNNLLLVLLPRPN